LLFVPLALALVLLFATTSIALADPFLYPVVGDGVNNADSHNGDNGVSVINPPVGTSQLPENNQAGANTNPNAHNTDNPDNPDAGPGDNPDYSPIWPG
jgi:hypothetical protein